VSALALVEVLSRRTPTMDSEDGSRLFVGGYEPYSESQPGPQGMDSEQGS